MTRDVPDQKPTPAEGMDVDTVSADPVPTSTPVDSGVVSSKGDTLQEVNLVLLTTESLESYAQAMHGSHDFVVYRKLWHSWECEELAGQVTNKLTLHERGVEWKMT